MLHRFLFLLLLACAFGCSNVETIENKDENGVLKEKITRRKDTFAKEGKYLAYYPNGQVFEESEYKNDTLHGERKLFYESSKLQSVERYKHGSFVGKFQKFYENGQLSNEGDFAENEMTGIWKRWYDTGELMEEVNFAKNQETGPFKEYHKNGKLKTEGTFAGGEESEQGELKKFDENGELTQKMYCEFGNCATAWSKEKGDVPVDTVRLKTLAELKRKSVEIPSN